ncbi:AP-3 complex subunit delta-1 [Pitangus sulphuratus]|nr:AP-3 complex subunit delta-1 [Pitangus sulphuratus]
MFDKNLQDLVRGIRNHKEDEILFPVLSVENGAFCDFLSSVATQAKYISQCIDEIKQELKQDNIAVKANAVCKLTYLQMLGYDISWAAFNIIEVMSASKFTFKRIGYLAASQCFHEGTDVIMLTTNQIRKDLSSPNQYDTGVALTGLSCFVTPDLARDLANDIMTLMSHTKPYIRKKAVLIMYKVFLKYPESLRPAFPRLKEKLEDPDPEPRLGKKLIEPLTNLIHRHLEEANQTLEAMLRPKVTTLPGHIQAVYVQNVVKLYASILQHKEQAGDREAAQEITQLMIERLPQFVQSADLEVQERASCILQLIKYIQKLQAKEVPVAEEVIALFAGELNPVAPKAQKKVPVPEGLDLDAWINEPPSDSESEDEKPKTIFHEEEQRHSRHRQPEIDEEELARRYQDTPGVEHIPVVQIDLSVPLKVPGMPMSDQYVKLEEERRHKQKLEKDKKKKKQKKEKRGKHHRHNSLHTESEEDIAPAHHVDIITEEMPENALPSDEDDKDPNDPYKALDIDLDKPLADSEKLPVQRHRNVETLKSPDSEAPLVEKKSKKPKKKEKKHKEKERDKGKKKEKEKKVVEEEEEEEQKKSKPAPGAAVLAEPQEARKEEREEEEEEEDEGKQKSSKHKKKKHKKEKEEKSKDKKKSKKKSHPSEEEPPASVQNGTLEDEPLPPMSSYRLLAENPYIKMTYDIQGNLQNDSQVTVSVIFENKSSSFLKSMELNVLDSLNTKMLRPEGSSVHDGIPVPFQLPPGISNEAQFVFTLQSIVMAQKLKGTLSFIVKNDEGSTHEKLDFKLHFSCASYLITTPCYSDAFAKLLESGDLHMSSIKVDGISISFQHLLAKICFHHHFSVVERVDSCASMYSRSIQGHHVCLLVKKGENSVSIDGKCNDSTLLSNLLDEMKETLSKC